MVYSEINRETTETKEGQEEHRKIVWERAMVNWKQWSWEAHHLTCTFFTLLIHIWFSLFFQPAYDVHGRPAPGPNEVDVVFDESDYAFPASYSAKLIQHIAAPDFEVSDLHFGCNWH